ncbi:hypothetical protein [Rubellimicrobium roseum]|uniref:hypothetical protein n=1 Tax=Rubellimicrobium roseum TaxID=687525 RepID=UPI00159BC753|nr:hypothetical protein [Rubellimicrobium roseum]
MLIVVRFAFWVAAHLTGLLLDKAALQTGAEGRVRPDLERVALAPSGLTAVDGGGRA